MSNYPLGLQNTATTFREATNPKTLVDLKKDLDSLLLLRQGDATDPWEAQIIDQINPNSGYGDQLSHDSTLIIRSTPKVGQSIGQASNPPGGEQ